MHQMNRVADLLQNLARQVQFALQRSIVVIRVMMHHDPLFGAHQLGQRTRRREIGMPPADALRIVRRQILRLVDQQVHAVEEGQDRLIGNDQV